MEDRNRRMAEQIAAKVAEQGGRVYYVGGLVRDKLLGIENKDVDIEIHGVTPETLEEILDGLGERTEMGVSFGIYGLKHYDVDIAMPRRERATGRGHRDFAVMTDPFLGTEKAAQRRDFTINALMEDVLSGALVDHYGGVDDLKKGVIRHVNRDTFVEDPLRVLRAAQFAARFGFTVAPETVALCGTMDLSALPKERIEGEVKKGLLKAARPSVFFEALREMGQLSLWFPEAEALIGVPQNPVYHGEGDVWTHTMMVLDEAARYRDQVSNPFGFMLAALTHDFGKAVCTETIDGKIHAYRHEVKGLPIVEAFLSRLTGETKLMQYVLNLTRLHMKPNMVAEARSSVKATNRMFDQAIDPEALLCIAAADDAGRISQMKPVENQDFLRERLALYRAYMARPHVMGKDLVEAGLRPGPDFSELLAFAHKLRLAGVEKPKALAETLAYARKLRGASV